MQKIFCFLTLTAALLCSGNAWADVTSVSALQTALSGASGTVVLGADLDLGKGNNAARFTINHNIVLDLNNHKLSGGGQDYCPTFNLKSGSTLTITSNNGTGTIDMSLNGYNGHLFDVVSNSTLNLTSANVVYKKGWLLFSSTSGTINITAGSFNVDVSSYIDQDNYEQVQENDLYVVKALKDICTVGTTNYKKLSDAITAAKAVTPYLPISLIENVTLTGDQNDELTFNGSKTLTITGKITAGTYNCSVSAGDGMIKGGLFATKPADAKIAEHYLCKEESGKWRVYLDPDFFVAKIGETKYASFEDAFAAAQANDEIKLFANVTISDLTSYLVFTVTKNLTLNLNGFTFTCNGKYGSSDVRLFIVNSGCTFTVTGAGCIDLSQTNNYGYIFKNNGTVVVDPGEGNVLKLMAGYQIYNGVGTSDIRGGKLWQYSSPSSISSYIDQNTYELVTELIDGKTFYVVTKLKDICTVGATTYKKLSAAISASQTSGDPIILIDNVSTDKLDQDVTFGESTYTLTCSGKITAGTYKCPVVATAGMIQGGSFKYDPSQYVDTELFNVTLSEGLYTVSLKPGMGAVVIGDQGYMTLADAIAAVPTTGVETTLKLMMPIEESATIAAGQNIVLDLNSKSITKINGHTIFNNGTLTVTDNSDAKTGAIISTNSAIMCYSGSTATILNGTIQGQGTYQGTGTITAYSGSHVYINGGTIVCNDGNHALLCQTSNASDVVMSGGTLTYTGSISSIVYVGSSCTGMTITDGHVDGSFGGKTSGDSRVLLEGGEYTTYPSTSYTKIATGYAIVPYPGNLYKVEEVFYQMTKGTCQHGSITLSGVDEDGYIKPGYTVTISCTPDEDYKLKTYKLNGVAISGNSFVASADTTVTAEFVAKDYIFQNTRTNVRYETLSDAVNSLVDNDTLKLLRNLNYAKTLQFDPLEKTFVIDMNGDTISGGDDFCIFKWMNGHITITNGTFNSSIGYAISSVGYNMTEELSNITLKDMTLIGSGLYCSYTNLVLDNVVIKDLTHYGSVWAYNSSVVTVKSGTYGSKSHGAIYNGQGCTLNIEGGSFGKDGSNNCIINNGTAHISGGLFAVAPTSDMLVSGYQVIETSDPTYKYTVVNQVIETPVEVTKEQPKTIEEGQKVAAPEVVVKEDAVLTIEQNASVVTTTLALTTTPTAAPDDDIYGKSSQITGAGASAIAAQNVYIDITMDPSGKLNASQYYAFAVPFNVNINDGVQKNINGTLSAAVLDEDYRAYTYDGANRASQGKGSNWKMVDANGTFTPGVFYLVEFANNSCNTFRFTKASGENLNNAANIDLAQNASASEADQGWNGIANNSLQNASFTSEATKAQVFEPNKKKFTTISLNSTSFAIGTPFFIQATGANQKANNSVIAAPSAPARMLAQTDDETFGDYTIRIKAEGATRMADQMFISASENATGSYAIGKDLTKMFMGNATVAQLWVNDYGKKLAVNQAVMVDNVAEASMTLYAPQAGNYTVYLKDIPEDATIYLLQDGLVVAELNEGAYTVALAKGENTQYGIRISAKTIPGVVTSVDEALVGNSAVRKVLLNGNVYIIRDGKMFNAQGQAI